MNRGVITISESGTVSMPTDTVWMTMQEIADGRIYVHLRLITHDFSSPGNWNCFFFCIWIY